MQGFVFTLFLLMASLAMDVHGGRPEAPRVINVGGKRGWQVPEADDPDAYNHWAERMRFRIGDSIRFQYQNDSVLVVDKYSYYHCKAEEPISSFDDGSTVIALELPGFVYFISGDYDHCKSGQRMIVDVISPHTRLHPSGPISPEPSPWATSSGPSPVSAQEAATIIVVMSVFAPVFALI